ncbi:MAG: PAC2 family protein [Candidatus Brocadiae bacterium]|nr:PAC2 family protein [Candidatus Brocadiia bacterium]
MADTTRQNRATTLVAVWPGMGQVASTAGYYLMSRLGMEEAPPIAAADLFDVEHVEIRDGLVRKADAPQGRLFLRKNPGEGADVAVFIGESQPPSGSNVAFCKRLLDAAEALGVRDVYTFAAMVSEMLPSSPSRVVGVATDESGLADLKRRDITILDTGRITGLNGVFLAEAAGRGMRGIGLLGEVPALAAQIPYPKASRTVLETFAALAGIEVDLEALVRYERRIDRQLTGLVTQIQQAMQPKVMEDPEEEDLTPDEPGGDAGAEVEGESRAGISDTDRARIDDLFGQARTDPSKSFELKQELDRLGVFKDYEDRFLDLFRKAG